MPSRGGSVHVAVTRRAGAQDHAVAPLPPGGRQGPERDRREPLASAGVGDRRAARRRAALRPPPSLRHAGRRDPRRYQGCLSRLSSSRASRASGRTTPLRLQEGGVLVAEAPGGLQRHQASRGSRAVAPFTEVRAKCADGLPYQTGPPMFAAGPTARGRRAADRSSEAFPGRSRYVAEPTRARRPARGPPQGLHRMCVMGPELATGLFTLGGVIVGAFASTGS